MIAVTAAAGGTPPLLDHADVVLDLCTPPGDALVRLEGLDTPVGPGSTIAAVALANELKVRTAEALLAQGALPPVITSPSVVGPGRSAELFDGAYAEHARRLARVLRGAVPYTEEEEDGSPNH